MNLDELKKRLTVALSAESASIEKHLNQVRAEGRSRGIEKAFTDSFHRACADLKPVGERDLEKLGLLQHYEGRETGRLDCYFPKTRTALEYQAVRLGRKESSPEFYAGQVLADYARLRNQDVLSRAYVVIFLYGPQVEDANSAGGLYRSYHNQMFVDCRLAAEIEGKRSTYSGELVEELLWDAPWATAKSPEWVVAVKTGAIGAVAFSAMDQWGASPS